MSPLHSSDLFRAHNLPPSLRSLRASRTDDFEHSGKPTLPLRPSARPQTAPTRSLKAQELWERRNFEKRAQGTELKSEVKRELTGLRFLGWLHEKVITGR